MTTLRFALAGVLILIAVGDVMMLWAGTMLMAPFGASELFTATAPFLGQLVAALMPARLLVWSSRPFPQRRFLIWLAILLITMARVWAMSRAHVIGPAYASAVLASSTLVVVLSVLFIRSRRISQI